MDNRLLARLEDVLTDDDPSLNLYLHRIVDGFLLRFNMRRTGFYIFAGLPGMLISRWRPVKQHIIR